MRTQVFLQYALIFGAASAFGCSSTVEIDVQLVDPCDQEAISQMSLLTFVPRGTGIDSAALSTTLDVSASGGQPFEIPLVPDFQMAVIGFSSVGAFEQQNSEAFGLSAPEDLTRGAERISVRVPFSLLNQFHRTTSLDDPTECTSLRTDRFGHTATYIPELKQVLIVGGARGSTTNASAREYVRAVELYDPDSGQFRLLGELPVGAGRAFHTATLLTDGRVLIAGGEGNIMGQREALQSALVIDVDEPGRPTILAMQSPRTGHRAVRLFDGRVMLIGGRVVSSAAADVYLSSVESFDPSENVFILPRDPQGNALQMSAARYGHTATVLRDARSIFVAGGRDENGPLLSPEVIRLVDTDTFDTVVSATTVSIGPIFHAAALHPATGGVVLSGGYSRLEDAEPMMGPPVNPRPEVEIWRIDGVGVVERVCTTNLNTARGRHTLSITGSRAVFIGGRNATGQPLAESEWAELQMAPGGQDCFVSAPETQMMSDARSDHAAARVDDAGVIFVSGGRTVADDAATATAEIFSPERSF